MTFHCIDYDGNHDLSQQEIEDLDTWVFQFGYMYEVCDGGYTLPTISYSGSDFRACWDDINGTDFLLLELQEQPEPGEDNFDDVYLNGWDRTGNIPNNTTCLHHRLGERMKIALDYQSPYINGNYWATYIDFGWIKFGSSGAPLYDTDHKVIGQVSSGIPVSACVVPHRVDFGRLSVSWDGGGTDDTRLSNWLDPDGTGATTLDGIHLPFNRYGTVYLPPGPFNLNAYDIMRVGSGDEGVTTPFRVEENTSMTLKAGREIVIRPCTQIVEGSTFRAHIEELDCSDIVYLSDTDDIYTSGCGGFIKINDEEFYENPDMTIDFGSEHSIINYPNPFSNTTEIKYKIEKSCKVEMRVNDIFGNFVQEIVNSPNHPAGTFHVTLDASHLSGSIYYLIFSADNIVKTKKMMIVK